MTVERLDAYLTIKEAAAYLGISPNTLRNWGRDGKVEMHGNPINGYRLFKKSSLESLLREIEESREGSSRRPKIDGSGKVEMHQEDSHQGSRVQGIGDELVLSLI
jgi:excisionase family DNA binding protein